MLGLSFEMIASGVKCTYLIVIALESNRKESHVSESPKNLNQPTNQRSEGGDLREA